jgi:hypothetical protein
MQRVSSVSKLARSRSVGSMTPSSSSASAAALVAPSSSSLSSSQQNQQHNAGSAATFSTFLGAVNTNTLGFLREKLITHDSDRRRTGGKKRSSADGLVAVSRDLHRNIFFNSNERSALRHVELTKDFIRLEFSAPNEEYRKHADLLFASEAERRAQGVPQWLVPVELQNNEHCGGGATILLDKDSVYDSLRHQARRRDTGRIARH